MWKKKLKQRADNDFKRQLDERRERLKMQQEFNTSHDEQARILQQMSSKKNPKQIVKYRPKIVDTGDETYDEETLDKMSYEEMLQAAKMLSKKTQKASMRKKKTNLSPQQQFSPDTEAAIALSMLDTKNLSPFSRDTEKAKILSRHEHQLVTKKAAGRTPKSLTPNIDVYDEDTLRNMTEDEMVKAAKMMSVRSKKHSTTRKNSNSSPRKNSSPRTNLSPLSPELAEAIKQSLQDQQRPQLSPDMEAAKALSLLDLGPEKEQEFALIPSVATSPKNKQTLLNRFQNNGGLMYPDISIRNVWYDVEQVYRLIRLYGFPSEYRIVTLNFACNLMDLKSCHPITSGYIYINKTTGREESRSSNRSYTYIYNLNDGYENQIVRELRKAIANEDVRKYRDNITELISINNEHKKYLHLKSESDVQTNVVDLITGNDHIAIACVVLMSSHFTALYLVRHGDIRVARYCDSLHPLDRGSVSGRNLLNFVHALGFEFHESRVRNQSGVDASTCGGYTVENMIQFHETTRWTTNELTGERGVVIEEIKNKNNTVKSMMEMRQKHFWDFFQSVDPDNLTVGQEFQFGRRRRRTKGTKRTTASRRKTIGGYFVSNKRGGKSRR